MCIRDRIIDAAETVPVMAERRLVVVRDWAPLMSGSSRNEDAEVKRMLAWLDSPPETAVTVFYCRGALELLKPVSYTHLDVYKRQLLRRRRWNVVLDRNPEHRRLRRREHL